MRLWHYQLLPYLPDLQFKGQLRELVLIMKQRREENCNHLLINRVMEYPLSELYVYAQWYLKNYEKRYGKMPTSLVTEMEKYDALITKDSFVRDAMKLKLRTFDRPRPMKLLWHEYRYLRVCMANLYEKHFYGKGKSRISDEEWEKITKCYEVITWEEYQV